MEEAGSLRVKLTVATARLVATSDPAEAAAATAEIVRLSTELNNTIHTAAAAAVTANTIPDTSFLDEMDSLFDDNDNDNGDDDDSDPVERLFARKFASFEQVHSALLSAAAKTGFPIAIRRKKPTATNVTLALFRCGKALHHGDRQLHADTGKRRDTSSRGTDCRFQIGAKYHPSLDGWKFYHVAGVGRSEHNHPMSPASCFPQHRMRALQAFRPTMHEWWLQGKKPAEVRHLLQAQYPEKEFEPKDVSNMLLAFRKERMAAERRTQAIFEVSTSL